jgi:S-adenosylmethionine hydrolase
VAAGFVSGSLESAPRITLLTDFGTRDGFVAAVKGVLASLAPGSPIDDVAHDVAPGDVRSGARALARYWMRYPAGTVHLVVVDPGVGTARRALACSIAERFLVGPDNGVLTPALASESDVRCVGIDERRLGAVGPVAPTFHGRDLFAPATAALASGRSLESLGGPVSDPVKLVEPVPLRTDGAVEGEVVAVDRFGNLTTNIPGEWAGRNDAVEIAGRRLELFRSYGEATTGALLAVIDSENRIEVALRDGSAAQALGIAEGARVRLVTS